MLAFNHLGRLGRLGNQMFQYAALRGIAANKKYDWCIPNYINEIDDGIGNKLKTELFDCFNLVNLSKKNIFILDQGHAPIVKEKFFHFDDELFNLCPNEVSLYGFFQSEKWFKHIESEIRDDFSFKSDNNLLSVIFNVQYCCLTPWYIALVEASSILSNDWPVLTSSPS